MIENRVGLTAERAVLVGLIAPGTHTAEDARLDELANLVEAAGAEPAARVVQRRPAIDPAYFIGKGKVQEVAAVKEATEADVVIFDNDLSPAQIREVEAVVKCKVLDRSELILDIFATRARTREAHLQVELAQLEYTAPRLRGMWTHLERIAGTGGGAGAGGVTGIGTRGPGETQIEIDRRIVSKRISQLKAELKEIDARKLREVQARSHEHFTVCLVGYTNAGKSTLMNTLTGAGTYTADQLFATLDTKTRRWTLDKGVNVLLSDTVGFVRDLPHHLVASFKATLEEAVHADLLLHVIDASHPQVETQIEAVYQVLAELGCDRKAIIPVLNKIDMADEASVAVLRANLPNAVELSAKTGEGLDKLAKAVLARRKGIEVRIGIKVPLADGRSLALARAHGQVHNERFDDTYWYAELFVPQFALHLLNQSGQNIEVTIAPDVMG